MADVGDDRVFLDAISARWSGFRFTDSRCLIGVSGGADSVALLLALLELHPCRERVEVGHFNHGWRGEESDADALFVADLCTRFEVPFHLGCNATEAPSSRSEADARDLRYGFLAKTAYAVGARTVVTAHTSDDRVETLVHHLFRGTGVAGAASIPHLRPLGEELLLVRPLIDVTRAEVESFLSRREQHYREDSSNGDLAYRRNYIRRKLLPEIRSVYGAGVDERLLRFTEHAADHVELLTRLSKEYGEEVFRRSSAKGLNLLAGAQVRFLLKRELPAEWIVVREYLVDLWKKNGWVLAPMSVVHWNKIREIFESQSADEEGRIAGDQSGWIRMNLPGDLQLVQKGPWLEISEKPA